MSANSFTVIDRRATLPCGCGCGQQATLPHFVKEGGQMVLPACLAAHRERRAAQAQLREIVTRPGNRLSRVGVVYRLQRGIFERRGAATARRTALRTAVIYLVGTRAGLWVAKLWRR